MLGITAAGVIMITIGLWAGRRLAARDHAIAGLCIAQPLQHHALALLLLLLVPLPQSLLHRCTTHGELHLDAPRLRL